MLFENVEIEYVDKYIHMKGLYASTFYSDIQRIYKFHIDLQHPNKIKLFFKIVQSGVFITKSTLIFHKFFALEMYFIFEKLFDITRRDVYKQARDILIQIPSVAKYFTPILELPSYVEERLSKLSVQLFAFQKHFLESYYNAREKLKMDGMILSYSAGGGKTFTTVASMWAFNLIPAIITAPRSVMSGWYDSILKMIPGIKTEEVKMINEYNPLKDNTKWKFLICNYERLDQAAEYSNFAQSKVKSIAIDECHNFRNLTTNRTQMLANIKKRLDVHDIIAISATPIKALGAEMVPIMKLLDSEFDDDAAAIFKRIYSRSSYDPITGSVLRDRLSIYLERKNLEESMKLPPKEMYNVEVRLNNPEPYLISTMKKNVWNYVNEHMPEFKEQAKPSLEQLQKLLKSSFFTQNFSKDEIDSYMEAVTGKSKHPFNKDFSNPINEFELEKVKKIDKTMYKQISQIRRKITSYMMILIGKALGLYFTKQKIILISQMVKENINAIADIINSGEQKTVIFSTFIQSLYSVKEELEKVGIGCILHTGNDDFADTLKKFSDDNVRVLLGTTSSIGTGSDGMQKYANQIIMLNSVFRYTDTVQIVARVHRKGSTASKVIIYFLRLITDEPNILDSETEINEWSRTIFRQVLD